MACLKEERLFIVSFMRLCCEGSCMQGSSVVFSLDFNDGFVGINVPQLRWGSVMLNSWKDHRGLFGRALLYILLFESMNPARGCWSWMFGSAAGFKHVSLRRLKQEMQLYSLSHKRTKEQV